ncbi:hypothetical protein SLEP1_g40945 [Rubroshorea leprosula]|uniref:Uncharacterized protein n=1 Tax=Rubroshorea leprosula TaxID=152421 RepID=A0AAV5L537_9ROSI|nr:hypothetical protein SLEP1_g40945 [Rubroshorea leprosula]
MLLPPLTWLDGSIAYPDLTECEPSLECFHFRVSTHPCLSCTSSSKQFSSSTVQLDSVPR